MEVEEVVDKVRESFGARRVFGEPIERDGAVIIPAARIRGGAGGGAGSKPGEQTGSGTGFGLNAKPAGAFIVSHGKVHWRPAIDVNRIIAGGQLVAAVALLTIGMLFRERWRLQHGRRLRRRLLF